MSVVSASIKRAAVLALVVLACACGGGDDDGGDNAAIDAAGIDATPPDAMPDRCVTMCSCAVELCQDLYPTEFADEATCIADCATLPEATKLCRIEHCGYARAPGGAPVHCPHVAGDPEAPSPTCVAP